MNGPGQVLRAAGLPALALALVGGVVGVQVAAGGGDFAPTRPADACADRGVTSRADGIDGLTEQLVLRGVDAAACTLGVTRESLVLDLAQQGEPTDAQTEALTEGLRTAVRDLAAADALPPPSALLDEALDGSDLNPLVEGALRALPDSVVDEALDTEDVLLRAIDEIDVRALLSDLDDPDAVADEVEPAVRQAVQDALTDRVRDLL